MYVIKYLKTYHIIIKYHNLIVKCSYLDFIIQGIILLLVSINYEVSTFFSRLSMSEPTLSEIIFSNGL